MNHLFPVWRAGVWLARINLVGALLYFGLILLATLNGGLPPAEPYQTLISVVTILSVPFIILLWVVVHRLTAPAAQLFSLASLVMMIIFATLTSLNRYNSLTVVPQALALGKSAGLEWFLPYGWPSIMAAAEVLAWGFYFGLACLCLAPAFGRGGREKFLFWTLVGCGGLSLISVVGQVLNSIPLNVLGVAAWGPGFMLLMLLWMRWFDRLGRSERAV